MDAYDMAYAAACVAHSAAHRAYLAWWRGPQSGRTALVAMERWQAARARDEAAQRALAAVPVPQDARTACLTEGCPGHHDGSLTGTYCSACFARMAADYDREERQHMEVADLIGAAP